MSVLSLPFTAQAGKGAFTNGALFRNTGAGFQKVGVGLVTISTGATPQLHIAITKGAPAFEEPVIMTHPVRSVLSTSLLLLLVYII